MDEELAHSVGWTKQAVKAKRRKLGCKRRKVVKNFYFSDVEKGILVGLIEGEGSLGLRVNNPKSSKRIYLYPYIKISNTDFSLLEWVKVVVKVGKIYTSEYRTGFSKKKIGDYLVVGLVNVSSLLRVLQPYFISDRRKKTVQLLIEFCEIRMASWNKGGTHPYSKREITIFKKVRELNRKGSGKKFVNKWLPMLNIES